jgi:pentatricopeptide repeat protein
VVTAQKFLNEFSRRKMVTSVHAVLEFLISTEQADFQFLRHYVQNCRRLTDSTKGLEVLEYSSNQGKPVPEPLLGSLAALAVETKNIALTRRLSYFVCSASTTYSGTIYGYLVSGYTNHELINEGVKLLRMILNKKVVTGGHPYSCLLSLSAKICSLYYGEEVLALYRRSGLQDPVVETAIIDMFGKCGEVEKAKIAFQNLRARTHTLDVMAWTAYLQSLALNGRAEEAISVFYELKAEGVKPNILTITVALQACSAGS